jgi:acyl-CoA thioesterase-1
MRQYFVYILSALLIITVLSLFQKNKPVRIVVFGDSLTSAFKIPSEVAYPHILETKLKQSGWKNVTVIAASVPGETTAGALNRVKIVLAQKPDLVVIEFSTNDIALNVPPEIIIQNLNSMMDAFKKAGSKLLLMCSTPVLLARERYKLGYNDVIKRYSGLTPSCQHLANIYDAQFYPDVLEGIAGQEELLIDHILHPNEKGVRVMVDRTYPLVEKALRNQ